MNRAAGREGMGSGDEIHEKKLRISLKKILALKSAISRGRGARTPIYGFGDRCSTIELFPYMLSSLFPTTVIILT